MALSRRIRLLEVRAELESPKAGTTVTEAAFRWGFMHLGRSAGEYAREFGERPSATLRRARDEGARRSAAAATAGRLCRGLTGWRPAGTFGSAPPLAPSTRFIESLVDAATRFESSAIDRTVRGPQRTANSVHSWSCRS